MGYLQQVAILVTVRSVPARPGRRSGRWKAQNLDGAPSDGEPAAPDPIPLFGGS